MRPESGDAAHLWDMADAVRKIIRSTGGVTREQFLASPDLRDLAVHRLEILGEAARRISAPCKTEHPHIPWSDMIAQRNVLAHRYEEIDYELVWLLI